MREEHIGRSEQPRMLDEAVELLEEHIRCQTHIRIVVNAVSTLTGVVCSVVREMHARRRFAVAIKAQVKVRPTAQVHREQRDEEQSQKATELEAGAGHGSSII